MSHLIDEGIDPSLICVLSFTNVAASELKKRINNIDVFTGTIHSLANKTLVDAGIDTTNIILEENFDELLIQATDVEYEKKPKFDYLIIDEFQDTGKMEYNFLLSLEIPHIMTIGDPRQRIYGFKNKNFDPIGNCLKSLVWTRYTITTNYRSPQNIIDFGESFIENQDFTYGRRKQNKLPSKPKCPDLPEKPKKPIKIPKKDHSSYEEIMQKIEEQIPYEEIIAEENKIKEENEKIAELNQILDEEYQQQKKKYVNKKMKLTEEYQEALSEWQKKCKMIEEIEKQHSVYDFTGTIINKDETIHINYIIGIIKKCKNYGDWAILCRWNSEVQFVLDILEEQGIPAETFKQSNFKDDTEGLSVAMKNKKVKVLTFHSAKGLEFNNVGVVTNHFSHDDFGKEMGRLLYVAATRAKKTLYWGLRLPSVKQYEKTATRNKKGKLMF